MVVKKITADPEKGPGYALLELDGDPGSDLLEISVLDIYRAEYLGPSTSAKVNWLKQPHYFEARRVKSVLGYTYRIGPEICNYVPPETMIEVSSRDGVIVTGPPIVWEGITVLTNEGGVILRDLPMKEPQSVKVNRPERPQKKDEKNEKNEKNEEAKSPVRPAAGSEMEAEGRRTTTAKTSSRTWLLPVACLIILLVAAAIYVFLPKPIAGSGPIGQLKADSSETLTFEGPQGGPFSPSNLPIRLLAEGRGFLWSLQGSGPDWLTVSPAQGELADNGSAQLMLSLRPVARTRTPGTYDASLTFNGPAGTEIARSVRLVVKPPQLGRLKAAPPEVLTFTGPQGGPFDPSGLSVRLTAEGHGLHWSMQGQPDWLTVSPPQGDLEVNDSVLVVLSLLSSAQTKTPGTYEVPLAFKGPSGTEIARTVRLVVKDRFEEFRRRGLAYAEQRDYEHAINEFDAAIRLKPDDAELLNDRCWVRAISGLPQLALEDCNEALRLRPGYVDALDSRGLVNLKLGRLGLAVADYNIVLQVDARRASSLYGRGKAKLLLGNDIAGGNADVAAAKSISPGIVAQFVRYGVQ